MSSMTSSAKKRKRDPEDCDYVDLSGPDPMYKRTAPACIPASSSTTFRVNTTAKGPDPNLMSYSSTFDSKAPYSYPYNPPAPATPAMMMPSASYSSYNYSYLHPQLCEPPVVAQPRPPFQEVLPPPAKKQRKKKNDPNEPAPEKRGAMFKKKCPQNILDRVNRVMSQRFFMVDRKRNGDELREEFSVLGSTGNVYTVTIDKTTSCNCPDASKGNHCKHILFIFLKVLQVSQSSGLWYQKALLTSELQDIFAHAPPAPNSVINQHVKDAYARATGKTTAAPEESDSVKKRRSPGPDDDCPICYEGMHGANGNTLIWCETCANAVHKECFTQWAKSCGHSITCVFCRSPWVDMNAGARATGKGKANVSEGYINLGAVAGLHQERDTSTYYHGSKRAYRHYGYQDYENAF